MNDEDQSGFEHLFPEDLLQDVLRGKHLEIFAEQISSCVYRYVMSRFPTGQDSDADVTNLCGELVAKIFGHKKIREIMSQGTNNFVRYLCTVMRNGIIDYARQLERYRARSGPSLDAPVNDEDSSCSLRDIIPSSQSPGGNIEVDEILQALDEFLAESVSTRDAEIYKLRVLHELSFEELSKIFSLGRSNLMVIIHRVRERIRSDFRKYLKERGYDL